MSIFPSAIHLLCKFNILSPTFSKQIIKRSGHTEEERFTFLFFFFFLQEDKVAGFYLSVTNNTASCAHFCKHIQSTAFIQWRPRVSIFEQSIWSRLIRRRWSDYPTCGRQQMRHRWRRLSSQTHFTSCQIKKGFNCRSLMESLTEFDSSTDTWLLQETGSDEVAD